jgi:hypothetical protein
VGVGTATPAARLDVRGNIKLGSSGQYSALGGQEDLRLVRGDVDGDGTILRGSGFSVNRFGEGAYDITFSPAFSGLPTVIPYANQDVNGQLRFAYTILLTSSSVRVLITNESHDWTDSDWSICVIGPR